MHVAGAGRPSRMVTPAQRAADGGMLQPVSWANQVKICKPEHKTNKTLGATTQHNSFPF